MNAAGPSSVRLAEIVALLSLGTDLGLGQPMEHMIRASLITSMADRLGLSGLPFQYDFQCRSTGGD